MISSAVFRQLLLWIALAGGCLLIGIGIFHGLGVSIGKMRWLWRKSKFACVSAILFVCALIGYGGSKGAYTRNVAFYRTDIYNTYLQDNGSYVTNDLVHLAFTTASLVPNDAMIYLDYMSDQSTDETEWVTAYSAPLGQFPRPLDLQFENAISNKWCCYTTWTPGPVEITNGVWQIMWVIDMRERRFLIPVNTQIEVDGEIVAPPTSKTTQEVNADE